jgi:two-component system sensor histidine kinase RegB
MALWDDHEVSITVSDDGPGFSPEVMDTLGEPYVTTRPSGQRAKGNPTEGSGLGLGFFIAKTLLERSGARVTVSNRSGPASGAAVRVSWPRSEFDLPSYPVGDDQLEVTTA